MFILLCMELSIQPIPSNVAESRRRNQVYIHNRNNHIRLQQSPCYIVLVLLGYILTVGFLMHSIGTCATLEKDINIRILTLHFPKS